MADMREGAHITAFDKTNSLYMLELGRLPTSLKDVLEGGRFQPILYVSKVLARAQRIWPSFLRELYSMVQPWVKKLHAFVEMTPFPIVMITDHRPLKWIRGLGQGSSLTGMVAKGLASVLQVMRILVFHMPGASHPADAFTRPSSICCVGHPRGPGCIECGGSAFTGHRYSNLY